MKIPAPIRILYVFFLAALGLQCDNVIAPASMVGGDVIYVTSFERDADTSGWEGYGFGLKDEAPPAGGRRSMAVSGGCIVPHGRIRLEPLTRDSRLIIRCWGRNLGRGGGISLQVEGNSGAGIYVNVQDTVWTACQSADTLFCPAGSALDLSVGAGGIVWSAMLIDMIEIRRVP